MKPARVYKMDTTANRTANRTDIRDKIARLLESSSDQYLIDLFTAYNERMQRFLEEVRAGAIDPTDLLVPTRAYSR